MKQMRFLLIGFFAAALVVFLAGPVSAYKTGNFGADFPSWGDITIPTTAINDGFQGTWFQYPNPGSFVRDPLNPRPEPQLPTGAPPTFWNEWWYDDPFVKGGKWINISFTWASLNQGIPGTNFPAPVDFHVTINWTNGGWVGQATPPIGATADPEQYIVRMTPWTFHFDPATGAGDQPGLWTSGKYWLPIDYNPEWVSVDVRGENVSISGGVLLHECAPVPLPAAVWLLGPGLLGIAALRRKFRG